MEFNSFHKRFGLQWKPIEDSDILSGKKYIISDKQFRYRDTDINVLEVVSGNYKRVASRLAHKDKPYQTFDVASPYTSSKQKGLLLHRARLIAFRGLDPDNPIARHGPLGGERP